jgi:hypothetical protein
MWDFDILNDPAFNNSNATYEDVKVFLKKNGKAGIRHTISISETDLKILNNMSHETPVKLQWRVWFIIQLHFARRGMEATHDMKKDDLYFEMKSDGVETMQLKDTVTKNHRSGENSLSSRAIMYSTGENACPIKLIKTYISKLSAKNPFLWQRPKQDYHDDDLEWYINSKIGINTLSHFMKNISQYCRLSTQYTNHSVRATSITHLGKNFQDSEIVEISGHKSLSSVGIYKTTSENIIRKMSNSLSSLISSTSVSDLPGSSISTSSCALPSLDNDCDNNPIQSVYNGVSSSNIAISSSASCSAPIYEEMHLTNEQWSEMIELSEQPVIPFRRQEEYKKDDKVIKVYNCSNFTINM